MQKRVIFAMVVFAVLCGLAFWLPREPKPRRNPAPASAAASRPVRATPIRRAARGRDAGSFAPAPSASSLAVEPGRVEQLHTSVLQAAVRGDWMTIDERGTPCPPNRVRIVYDAPEEIAKYTKGAYFEPLGPRPSDHSQEVNGLLLCEGSSFLYLGFEAYYRADRRQWDVFPFPEVE